MGVAGIGPRHTRAGRKLAGLTVQELAQRSGRSPAEILELEAHVLTSPLVACAVQEALEAEGVRFHFAEFDDRLAVYRTDGEVAAPILIEAGCGMLAWSWRKLCRRSGLFAGDLRRQMGSKSPDPRMMRRCLAVLSLHGCAVFKHEARQPAGVELRRSFWNRDSDWPVFLQGRPRGWE